MLRPVLEPRRESKQEEEGRNRAEEDAQRFSWKRLRNCVVYGSLVYSKLVDREGKRKASMRGRREKREERERESRGERRTFIRGASTLVIRSVPRNIL